MLSQAENLLQQGQVEQALSLLDQYAVSYPQDVHGWFLLGIASHQSRKLDKALQALEQVLSLAPNHLQAKNIKAIVLCDLGQPQEALQVYREALLLTPGDATLLLNMAIVLEQKGDLIEALKHYDQVLQLQPDLYPALLNRGALLLRLGHKQDALSNNLYLAAKYPNSADAQFNLGEAHLALDDWKAALAAYNQTLKKHPKSAKTHFACGLALSMLRRFEAAQQVFAKAQSLDPEICNRNMRDATSLAGGELSEFSPQVIYLLKEAQRLHSCDWSQWRELITEFETQISCSRDNASILCERTLLFPTLALPLSSTSRFTLAQSIAARIAEIVNTAAYPTFNHPDLSTSDTRSRKIKIGYISPDFRKHPIATLSRRLYALHDRKKFDVYGYALRPDDGSKIRQDIEQGCDFFREFSGLDDRTAAETIHRDGIDILVDLAGYTSYARPEIFAMRPAPLQLFYLAFLHSTGANFIDYVIADPVVITANIEKYFSEKIAYLPDSQLLFDNQQAIASVSLKRENFGLPGNSIVFCCHNNNYKITPDVFDSWMHILQQVTGSVLWLLKSNELVPGNLHKEAALRGIEAERLIFADFVPNEIHLARYRLADLFLDTFLCNAGTTAAEALWAGLPVLTCAGETMASRVCASLLSAVGMQELITTSPQQYEEKAVYLATHPDELKRLHALLKCNRMTTPLFNTERQVKNIEAVYQHIWQRHKAGLPPETFYSK